MHSLDLGRMHAAADAMHCTGTLQHGQSIRRGEGSLCCHKNQHMGHMQLPCLHTQQAQGRRTAGSIWGQNDMGMPKTTPSRLMFLSTGAAHDTPGAGSAPMPLVVALESLVGIAE